MPATEKTWWNMQILHITFCVLAVMLLVATVVMLAADHNRPWKKYQRKFRALETWSAAAQVDSEDSLVDESKAPSDSSPINSPYFNIHHSKTPDERAAQIIDR